MSERELECAVRRVRELLECADDRPVVELLRSRYDGKTLAIGVADIRHGADAGPWTTIAHWPLNERVVAPVTLLRELCDAHAERLATARLAAEPVTESELPAPWRERLCEYKAKVIAQEKRIVELECAATAAPAPSDAQDEPGVDTPWPLREVLYRLADAAAILLDDHSYDGHDYEKIRYAQEAARRYAAASVSSGAGESAPRSPLPWKRRPYSGSTDSWIADANGRDICRVSGTNVAIRDADAEAIVRRMNQKDVNPAPALCASAEIRAEGAQPAEPRGCPTPGACSALSAGWRPAAKPAPIICAHSNCEGIPRWCQQCWDDTFELAREAISSAERRADDEARELRAEVERLSHLLSSHPIAAQIQLDEVRELREQRDEADALRESEEKAVRALAGKMGDNALLVIERDEARWAAVVMHDKLKRLAERLPDNQYDTLERWKKELSDVDSS